MAPYLIKIPPTIPGSHVIIFYILKSLHIHVNQFNLMFLNCKYSRWLRSWYYVLLTADRCEEAAHSVDPNLLYLGVTSEVSERGKGRLGPDAVTVVPGEGGLCLGAVTLPASSHPLVDRIVSHAG